MYGPNQCLHCCNWLRQYMAYMAVRTIFEQLEQNAQRDPVKMDGVAIIVERRGTWSRIALRHLGRPQLHFQSTRDYIGRQTVPSGVGFRGGALKTIRTEGAQESPHKEHLRNTWGTLGINNCEGPIHWFLFRYGATFSVLTEAPGLLSSQSASSVWLSAQAKTFYFSYSLRGNWDSLLFSHALLISLTPFGEGYSE